MPSFKYQVCKGNTVVARTTTLAEAKAEAKRVGGHYEPLAKNPNFDYKPPHYDRPSYVPQKAWDRLVKDQAYEWQKQLVTDDGKPAWVSRAEAKKHAAWGSRTPILPEGWVYAGNYQKGARVVLVRGQKALIGETDRGMLTDAPIGTEGTLVSFSIDPSIGRERVPNANDLPFNSGLSGGPMTVWVVWDYGGRGHYQVPGVGRYDDIEKLRAPLKYVSGQAAAYGFDTKAKNPVDPDYTKKLGEGAFSGAFKREFDPGVRGVQNITIAEDPRGSIDVAKMVLIEARKALKGNRKAQAYLPNIRPVRIDYRRPDHPEFIYAQPLLAGHWQGHKPANLPWMYDVVAAVDYTNSGLGTLHEAGRRIEDALKRSQYPEARKQGKPIREALEEVHRQAIKYSNLYRAHRYNADMHSKNYGMDRKDKQLVIFDPFVYTLSVANAMKMWKDLGYPNAEPKAAKPKAAAKPVKTAKVPRKKGKGAFPKKVPVTLAPAEIKAKFRNKKDVMLFIVGFAEGGKLWPEMTLEMADTFGNVKSDRAFFASHKAPSWLVDRVRNVLFRLIAVMTKDAQGAFTLKIKPAELRDIMLKAKKDDPVR